MKKRLLSIVTATAMTLSAIPYMVSAETTEIPDSTSISIEDIEIVAQGECGENTEWTLDSNGKLTINSKGSYLHNEKTYSPFIEYADLITDVIIEDGITVVGAALFYDLKNIKSVSLPDSLEVILPRAFENCENLSKINIPKSIRIIKEYAFENTEWLANMQKENPLVIVNNLVVDGKKCVGDVNIPDGVIRIPYKAFENATDITSIKLPDTITSIDIRAFEGCINLKEITIPNGLEELSYGLFENCTMLTTVKLHDNVKYINQKAFYDCTALKEITIPKNVEYIDNYALGFYEGENGAEKIDGFTIKGYANSSAQAYAEKNGFKFVAIDEDTDTTEIVAQGECGENTEWILNSNGTLIISGEGMTENTGKYFSASTFSEYSDKIINVIVGEGITMIDYALFKDLKELKSVSLPESLEAILPIAFQNCEKLTEINIPKNLSLIKLKAFDNTAWLKNKLDENPLVIVNDIVIDGRYCKGDIEISDGIVSIGTCAFENAAEITSVKIPDSVTSIGSYAFVNCTSLKSVDLPNNLTQISDLCFGNCSSLESINIPESVEFIKQEAFFGCTSLKEIEIPKNVEYIDEYALGFYEDENGAEKIDGFTIKGYVNSYAQRHAKYNELNFVALDGDNASTTDTTTTTTTVTTTTITTTTGELSKVKGDTNLDGKLDLSDAVLIMQSLASPEKYGLNGTNPVHMTEQGKINGDIDKNGLTNADALEIQKYILRIHDSKYFQVNVNVIVTEITDESIIVTPVADSPELKSSDKFVVPLTAISDGTTPKVDSEYSIKYDGAIMETYPAQFVEIFDMRIVG